MTVASPWVLWAAMAAAVGVFIAHLLSVRRPPLFMLPTTRFLPPRTVRAVSMSARPTDLMLLMLRLLAVLCAGLAFAGVQWTAAREPVLNMLVVDAASVGDDSLAWRASIDRALQESPAAAVVLSDGRLFVGDSLALAGDSLAVMPSRTGSLASALLAAQRSARRIAPRGDSIALLLVSPLRTDANTEVLDTVRAMWPGRITVIPVSLTPAMNSVREAQVVVRSARENDAVMAAFTRWRLLATADVRVVRDRAIRDDTDFARNGGVLVLWPDEATEAESPADSPADSPAVSPADSPADSPVDPLTDSMADALPSPAVIANGQALVARGMTPVTMPGAFAIDVPAQAAATGSVRTIAWWPDGNAAVTERDIGRGCVREVLFTTPSGDALLNVSARGVLAALSAPCGVAASLGTRSTITAAQVAMLRGDGPLASAAAFRSARMQNPWARWLLLAAVSCLVAEMFVRRRSPVLAQ